MTTTVNAAGDGLQARGPFVEAQEQPLCQKRLDGVLPAHQHVSVLVEQDGVVHVAYVVAGLQLVLDELVQSVEVHVSEELGGQLSNAIANFTWQTRETRVELRQRTLDGRKRR